MKCFLYPDIGRIDEPLQLHMDGLIPNEIVNINFKMTVKNKGIWESHLTTKADHNGKLMISDQIQTANDLSKLIWNLSPKEDNTYIPFPHEQSLNIHIDIEATESNTVESRTVTRLFKEDYVDEETFTIEDIEGKYYFPKDHQNVPSLIILGESENDISPYDKAALFASHGYGAVALNVSYKSISEFPLERIHQTIDWLREHPTSDENNIILFGYSKGAELALLVASKNKHVSGVIANAPSSHVFQGDNRKKRRSSWTENGIQIPFVPVTSLLAFYLNMLKIQSEEKTTLNNNIYRKSIEKYDFKGKTDAVIKVENVRGPILLVSGDQDTQRPTTWMCQKIVDRLKTHSFPYEVKHLSYSNAEHYFLQPYLPLPSNISGKALDHAIVGEKVWKETLNFLNKFYQPATIPTQSYSLQLTTI